MFPVNGCPLIGSWLFFVQAYLCHDSLENFSCYFAAVFGRLAQLVLCLLVCRDQPCTARAASIVAQAAVSAAKWVLIPRLQFFGKITNLICKTKKKQLSWILNVRSEVVVDFLIRLSSMIINVGVLSFQPLVGLTRWGRLLLLVEGLLAAAIWPAVNRDGVAAFKHISTPSFHVKNLLKLTFLFFYKCSSIMTVFSVDLVFKEELNLMLKVSDF